MNLDRTQDEFIEQLYRKMYYSLLNYAANKLEDRSLAEEAVQDVFKIAWAKIEDLISSPNPKGWLYKTLKKTLLNMNRSRARWNSLLVSFQAFDESAVSISTGDMDFEMTYRDLIGSENFELLKKIVLDKYSIAEAAEELNISVEACKKRVQRAKKKLRDTLSETERKS